MISKTKINFIYNSIYYVLITMLPLITTPYVSRALGAESIGIYAYAHSIAYYFVMFIMLGLNNYGNRSIAIVKDNREALSRMFIGIYTMQMGIAIIAISTFILYTSLFANNPMNWIMLFYLASAAIDINWFYFGLEEFKLTVTRNVIVKIVSTICIFLFVKTPGDVYLYGVIMTANLLVSQLIIWPFVWKYINWTKVDKNEVIKHIKPNLLLFIPIVAISLYKMMDKIMLGAMTDMVEVGLYESSEKVINVPMAIVNALGTVMLPRMANMFANKAEEKAKEIFSKSIVFAVFISSAMCFGIMGLASAFVPWFYGEGFDKCIILFQFLLPSCIFLSFANVIRTQYLIPKQEDKTYIQSVFLGAGINLLINKSLIPVYGSIGAAIGTLFAEAGVCIWQSYKVRHKLEIKSFVLRCLPFVFAGGVMYIVLLTIPNISETIFIDILAKICIGASVFLLISGCYFAIMKKLNIKFF